jgi:predicted  nucleic acid-binding Zn-ribbon protein
MSSLTPSDKRQHLEALKEEYASLESESTRLEEKLTTLKNSMTSAMSSVEVEEEKIANNLFRRFDHVWKEKIEAEKSLAHEIQETNSLTREIAEIQAQLGDVERTIEQEHELMLHKLQKQLIDVTGSKLALQRSLAIERGRYLQLLQERVALVDQAPGPSVDAPVAPSPPHPQYHHARTNSAGSSSSGIRVTSTRSTPMPPPAPLQETALEGKDKTKYVVSQLQQVLNSMLAEQHVAEQQCVEDEEFMSLLFNTLTRVQSEATADRDRLANTEASLAKMEADLAVASSRAR